MKKYWINLKYILEHKKNVFIEGRKLNLGVWQLFRHDLSKFTSKEFKQYSDSFFSGESNPEIDKAMDYAWLNHKRKNKHHWQYWLDIEKKAIIPLEMPLKYEKEMMADWNAMSRKFHPDEDVIVATKKWFDVQTDIIIHDNTRRSIMFYFRCGVFDSGSSYLGEYLK